MSTTGGPSPADSWTAIAPFGASILTVFINPPICTVKSHRRGRSRPRKLGVKCDPSGDVETRTVTPSGVPDATAALSCDECVIGAADCNRQSFPSDTGGETDILAAGCPDRPRSPFPSAALSCIAPHNQPAERCYVRRAV